MLDDNIRLMKLISLWQVASYLSVSESKVHKLIRDGRLPHVRHGRRVRVYLDDLVVFASSEGIDIKW